MKKICTAVLAVIMMFALCGVAFASGGAQLYQGGSINHRVDIGPLAKGSASSWTGGSDNNTYVHFVDSSLAEYQKSQVITDSGVIMSSQLNVYSGKSKSFTIRSAYTTVAHANLRISNPYYGTGSASTMSTKGDFDMDF